MNPFLDWSKIHFDVSVMKQTMTTLEGKMNATDDAQFKEFYEAVILMKCAVESVHEHIWSYERMQMAGLETGNHADRRPMLSEGQMRQFKEELSQILDEIDFGICPECGASKKRTKGPADRVGIH